MPVEKISFRPGVNTQATATLNEGGWIDASLIRFRDGLPQPVGGWAKVCLAAVTGKCRAIKAWVTLGEQRLAGLGTSAKLYLLKDDSLIDITPAGLAAGNDDNLFGSGWGAGPWGAGTWGTTRTGLVGAGTARLWSLDTWGEELVASPRDGAIYNWKPSGGYGTAAAVISGAPTLNHCILTGMPERHLIAFGADVSGAQDPLLVRWSDVEDYTSWTATATNSAGSFRIVGGTSIYAAMAAPGEILIFTDSVLYAMRFQGLPYVYGFYQVGSACGVIAPGGAAVLGGAAYWMGNKNFWSYAGQVRPIPCDVWDAVFMNLNAYQTNKIVTGVNAGFGEISWFYPSAGSVENDSYVTYHPATQKWWTGMLSRTAWADAGTFFTPIAAGGSNYVYAHEIGANADGAPMDAFVQSGYFDIGDGDSASFVDRVVPDFKDQNGPVQITLTAQMFPNGGVTTKGPYTMTPDKEYLSSRIRGGQVAVRLESNQLNAFWRLGAFRMRVAPDGKTG